MKALTLAKAVPRGVVNILVVLAVAFVLLVFLPQAHKTLTIAIHQGVEGVALGEVASRFAVEKKVPVELIELPYNDLFEAELKQIENPKGSAYDVIMADDPWMPAFLGGEDGHDLKDPSRYHLKPISIAAAFCDQLVPSLLEVIRSPSDKSDATCKDKFYAAPFVGNSQLFAFRKDPKSDSTAPVQPPRTWDEAIKNPGYVMRVGPGNPIVTDFITLLWDASPDSFQTNNPAPLRLLVGAQKAFGYLSTLGSRPKNLGIISYDDFDLAIQVAKGQASMSIVWSAWAMAMAHLPEPQRRDLFRNIAFAQVPGEKPELGAWVLAMPKNSDNSNAADFIAFATGYEQLKKAALSGNPRPLQTLFDDAELKMQYPKSLAVQLTSLMTAKPRPRNTRWRAVEKVLGRCLSAAYESALVAQRELGEPAAVARANEILINRANAGLIAVETGQPVDGFNCMKD